MRVKPSPPHESVRREFLKTTLGTLYAGIVAIGHEPYLSVWPHQIDDEFSLFVRTVGAHESDRGAIFGLPQPPGGWEPLDHEEMIHGAFDAMSVVQQM